MTLGKDKENITHTNSYWRTSSESEGISRSSSSESLETFAATSPQSSPQSSPNRNPLSNKTNPPSKTPEAPKKTKSPAGFSIRSLGKLDFSKYDDDLDRSIETLNNLTPLVFEDDELDSLLSLNDDAPTSSSHTAKRSHEEMIDFPTSQSKLPFSQFKKARLTVGMTSKGASTPSVLPGQPHTLKPF